MGLWRDFRRDMAAELFLLAYAIAWVIALLVILVLSN